MKSIRACSLLFVCCILLLIAGCANPVAKTITAMTDTPTLAPTSTPLPSATPTLTQAQITIVRLQSLGFESFEIINGQPVNVDGSPISVDSLDVITALSEKGLSWWNSENKSWVVVDPINPETYHPLYLEHWNSLATRTPVAEATAEDIVFNDFQIETYRDFFPSIQSDLNQDPLWQTFFQASGSDFSAMTTDQVYQASLLYGQTSKKVIMPIVLFEQQNQANPENWKFTYETGDGNGITNPLSTDNPSSEELDRRMLIIKNSGKLSFDQKFLGTNIHIDNIPIEQIMGIIQAQFRIPGVDPNTEVGLVISFDEGRHLDVGASFQKVTISPGDPLISYAKIEFANLTPIATSSNEQIFPALTDIGLTKITRQQLQELIGTLQLIDIGAPVGDINRLDIFSKNSGLQLVGIIWR